MQRKAYGRDAGLSARMLVTTFLLGLLYVVFAVVLIVSAPSRVRSHHARGVLSFRHGELAQRRT